MNTSQDLTASRKRAAHPEFVSTFGLGSLQADLPLRFPAPEGYAPVSNGATAPSTATWAMQT